MTRRVGVIDYGAGNVTNVSRALDFIGVDNELVDSPDRWERFSHLILPGVGSFVAGMEGLRARDLEGAIGRSFSSGTPLLGSCLGMQLVFERGEEGKGSAGLSLVSGDVRHLGRGLVLRDYRIPHVGWSEVVFEPQVRSMVKRADSFFFSHSFEALPSDPAIVTSRVNIGSKTVVSSFNLGALTGVQFHPEKSGEQGLDFLRNWIENPGI